MTTTPLILVPGFWLGGWAWDDVVAALPDDLDAHAPTLPGLEPGADLRQAEQEVTPCLMVRSSVVPVAVIPSGARDLAREWLEDGYKGPSLRSG